MLKMYRIQIFCRNGDRHVIYAEFANTWDATDAMMVKFPQYVWIIPTECRGCSMDAENKKRIRMDVDMSRIHEIIHTNFVTLTYELEEIVADMVDQMNLEPENKNRAGEVILAQAMLIYADGGATVAEQAKKVLVGVTKVEGRMH